MHLSAINIFPVKGLGGVAAASAAVEPWGLAGDRRWMLVNASGRFLSQREAPRMAVIGAVHEGRGIRLSTTGRPDLRLDEPPAGQNVEVMVWRDRVPAVAAGPAADAWASEALGLPCRLVYMADPAGARPVDAAYGTAEDRVSFADGFPLLAANSASLADLARRAGMPDLSMARFRTNLVIEGAAPWAEDSWREIRIGEAVFASVKPCGRCTVVTVDPTTGERHPDGEPLRSLLAFRRNERGQPIFGQNLIPRSAGEIRVGDPVTIA